MLVGKREISNYVSITFTNKRMCVCALCAVFLTSSTEKLTHNVCFLILLYLHFLLHWVTSCSPPKFSQKDGKGSSIRKSSHITLNSVQQWFSSSKQFCTSSVINIIQMIICSVSLLCLNCRSAFKIWSIAGLLGELCSDLAFGFGHPRLPTSTTG